MKRYRLKESRKKLIENILLGIAVGTLTVWFLHTFWIEFIYGIQW